MLVSVLGIFPHVQDYNLLGAYKPVPFMRLESVTWPGGARATGAKANQGALPSVFLRGMTLSRFQSQAPSAIPQQTKYLQVIT